MINIIFLTSGLALQGWLTLILWRKKVYRQFPLFFDYNIYGTLVSAARLIANSDPYFYFYVFWWTDLGILLLSIASLHEAFRSVFEGFYLLKWFRRFYFGGICVPVAAAAINSIFNRPVQVHPMFRIVHDVETPIYCVEVAIFGLFYLCARLLHVSFSRHAFAITLGFGISALGTLIPLVVRSEFGKKFDALFFYAPPVAYYVTLLLWLSTFFLRKAEEEQQPLKSPDEMAEEVREYTRVLKSFFARSDES
jgi:hypothetical protein